MEDDPLFNVGRGVVFTAEGRNELDASIMDGSKPRAGSVLVSPHASSGSRARAVMEHSRHVMLIGEGAEAFARSQNLEQVDPSYFFTERRWQQLEQNLRANNLPIPPRSCQRAAMRARASSHTRTITSSVMVGVVAYDQHGNIAAGTSTAGPPANVGPRRRCANHRRQGPTRKMASAAFPQRAPANSSSASGVARDICARMEFGHESAQEAADHVIAEVGATTTNASGRRWRRHRA